LERAGWYSLDEKHGLRLVVHLASSKGYVRFVVINHRDPKDHPDRLIGSGTLEDIGKAKNEASDSSLPT
jgi:hypothetical protein